MSKGDREDSTGRHEEAAGLDRFGDPDSQEPADDSTSEGTSAEVAVMTESRRVYGNEMLYVSLADGAKVGRINLVTGKVTMDQPGLRSQFDLAVAHFRAEEKEGVVREPSLPPMPDAQPDPVPSPPPIADSEVAAPIVVMSDGHDLATNRPGASVREKAIELKDMAPVRTFLARAFGIRTDERDWRVGANGEEAVASRLRRLGEGWRVIHSVPVGENGSDIDHVVVGPAGVFTLNTKNHISAKVWVAERTFMVNGQKTSYLRNSRHEATRASKLLSIACGFTVIVEPVIVVLAAKLTIKAQPLDVHVVARRQIDRWLSRRPQLFESDRVAEIYEQARRDSTWRPAP